MFRLWGKIAQFAPIFAIYVLLTSRINATEIPKNQAINFNKADKSRLKIAESQANLINNLSLQSNQFQLLITQVNDIKQLNDIKPTDWSYEALKNLIERYGCIDGFPKRTTQLDAETPDVSRTYRGQQSITRDEFVAGLNACLNKIEKTIALSQDFTQTDLDTLLRLMQEFQTELAILQGRTDGSRARIDDLSATQFSTTTKLRGEAIVGLGSILSGNSENNANNTILGSRLRLELATSFQGNDLLFTRLSRNGFPGFESEVGTWQGNLAFAEPDDDDFELTALHYSFSVGDRLDFIIGAAGIDADDIAPTINVLDGDGGSGAISDFGTRNPLYYPPGDAGLGITHRPVERIEISAGYLASPANESSSGSGLFNGPYSALGQITVTPFPSLNLSATYVHSYNQSDTETGTNRANLRSLTAELFGQEVPTISNSYGLELSWAISDRLVIGGWGSLSKVSNLSTLNQQIERGTQDIWNWAATLAISDLGKEGSLMGIVVGSEPQVTNSTIDNLEADSEQSLHLEAFYQYQVNDNIAITPGVVWITKPDPSTTDLDDLVIGTIRTTFSF
ncbi:MAG: iron uptake porin [Pleurocapsa sp.]